MSLLRRKRVKIEISLDIIKTELFCSYKDFIVKFSNSVVKGSGNKLVKMKLLSCSAVRAGNSWWDYLLGKFIRTI